jgi:hypothetical protein
VARASLQPQCPYKRVPHTADSVILKEQSGWYVWSWCRKELKHFVFRPQPIAAAPLSSRKECYCRSLKEGVHYLRCALFLLVLPILKDGPDDVL